MLSPPDLLTPVIPIHLIALIPLGTTMTAILVSTIHPETTTVATADPPQIKTTMATTALMMPPGLANVDLTISYGVQFSHQGYNDPHGVGPCHAPSFHPGTTVCNPYGPRHVNTNTNPDNSPLRGGAHYITSCG
jgi:hypothetical protein